MTCARIAPRPPAPADYGLGNCATSLALGCDCLGHIRYFDAVLNNSAGEPVALPHAVCMHEEDVGLLWKHVDYRTGHSEARRCVALCERREECRAECCGECCADTVCALAGPWQGPCRASWPPVAPDHVLPCMLSAPLPRPHCCRSRRLVISFICTGALRLLSARLLGQRPPIGTACCPTLLRPCSAPAHAVVNYEYGIFW